MSADWQRIRFSGNWKKPVRSGSAGNYNRRARMAERQFGMGILRRGHDWNRSLQKKEEQKARSVKSGLPVFWLNGVGYLVAALVFPTSATTPSCCIKPRASQLTQPSTILPFVTRATLIR